VVPKPLERSAHSRHVALLQPQPDGSRAPDRQAAGGESYSNLPAQLTSFIGREREIAEVKRLLSATRLLSLTGEGGIGKTRLALRVAADYVGAYANGVWHVELGTLADPAGVPQAVAAVLGVRAQPGRPLATALAHVLKPKELLLVLDNCEHVADACAALAAQLLRACSRLKVLVATRIALGTPGETTWRVRQLSLPDPELPQTVDTVLDYEAPRLFAERAAAARPSFVLTEQNLPAVVEVCRRLDGIPLAIELSAARVGALTAQQIAARLGDRFRLLEGGSRAGPTHHQTLRALVDWSHELLSGAERRLFRQLAVFAGGWSLEAAERVCGDEQTRLRAGAEPKRVLDVLEQLVDKSLVLAEEQQGEMRYRMLETIRQYAEEKLLDSRDGEVIRARHKAWIVSLAEAMETELRGPREAAWLTRLEREHANLTAALNWSQGRRRHLASRLRLMTLLFRFWYVHGYFAEGLRWLEEALRGTRPLRSPLRVEALNDAGLLAWAQGDYPKALSMCGEALNLARALGDKRGVAFASSVLGRVLREKGEQAQAVECFEKCLACYSELGDEWGTALALENLGSMAWLRGDTDEAARLAEQSLALCKKMGNQRGIAIALSALGQVAWHGGNVRRAGTLLRDSLALLGELEDKRRIAQVLGCLGALEIRQRDYGRGATLLAAAEALSEEVGAEPPTAFLAASDEAAAAARLALGEAGFARAVGAGRALRTEQAIAYALAAQSLTDATSVPSLTERELEVSRLIAKGLSNRGIAAELVISELTAETHVRNILRKLQLSARTQIAAWAAQQGL
jgi:non-specific serine/threonine protein kinase